MSEVACSELSEWHGRVDAIDGDADQRVVGHLPHVGSGVSSPAPQDVDRQLPQ